MDLLDGFPISHALHVTSKMSQDLPRTRIFSPGPSIIYVTNESVFPPVSGGAVREYNLLKYLAQQYEIHFVAFTPRFEQERSSAERLLKLFASVTLVKPAAPLIDHQAIPLRVLQHAHPEGRRIIAALLDRYKPVLLHLEGYFLYQHLPNDCSSPVVLGIENIEYELGSCTSESIRCRARTATRYQPCKEA